MRTHLSYRIHDDRLGIGAPLPGQLATAFVTSIHQQVAAAVATTKGYAETLQLYWYNDGHAIERRDELPGFTVTFSDLAGTANASSEAWPHWFAVLGADSLRDAAYTAHCSATETEETVRAYAELANLRFCILDGRLAQISRQAERVFGDGWSAGFAELTAAQRKIVDRVTRADACGCAVCERRRLIDSEPAAAANLPKHLARFREDELANHFYVLRSHPRRWEVLLAATRHAKAFVRKTAWTEVSLALLAGRGVPPDSPVLDELVQALPAALGAGRVLDLRVLVSMVEHIAGLYPDAVDGVVSALTQIPSPLVVNTKPRLRAAFAELVARIAQAFPRHATTLEPLLALHAGVLGSAARPNAIGLRLQLDADEPLRVFSGGTELCTTLTGGRPLLIDLAPQPRAPNAAPPQLELTAVADDGKLVGADQFDGRLVLRLPTMGTLSVIIRSRRWLSYNFSLA